MEEYISKSNTEIEDIEKYKYLLCNDEYSNNFIIHKHIYNKKFEKLFLIQNIKNEKFYYMKSIENDDLSFKNQIIQGSNRSIIQNLEHSNFIYDISYAFEINEQIFFLLEYNEVGELYYYIKEYKLNEEEIKFIVAQVILAIEHIHLLNFIYRDLNLRNIYIGKDGYIKLSDYGSSKYNINYNSNEIDYLAPEIIKQSNKYNKSVDFWSVGILIYELFTGKNPFYDEKITKMYKNILNNTPKKSEIIPCDAMDLINLLLEKKFNKRIGFDMKDCQLVKSHKFFKNLNWDDLKSKNLKSPLRIPKDQFNLLKNKDSKKLSKFKFFNEYNNIFIKNDSKYIVSLKNKEFIYKKN